eukprot:1145531-Pelagomonas_calceolata.AAC.2
MHHLLLLPRLAVHCWRCAEVRASASPGGWRIAASGVGGLRGWQRPIARARHHWAPGWGCHLTAGRQEL